MPLNYRGITYETKNLFGLGSALSLRALGCLCFDGFSPIITKFIHKLEYRTDTSLLLCNRDCGMVRSLHIPGFWTLALESWQSHSTYRESIRLFALYAGDPFSNDDADYFI